ncbi:MAG TPA: helicase-associated domain-containing protein [Ktedonobacteraceae bacterium]|nr:helicase-associated domain-containing protein [Ktedonobacteraceae bacterium]
MNEVVPGILQRLRAVDIIRMAGLQVASLGQEYARKGSVQATKRQGARLLGIVVGSSVTRGTGVTATEEQEAQGAEHSHHVVEIELQNANLWIANCTCRPTGYPSPTSPGMICQHAAALLYQWLAHPSTFGIAPSNAPFALSAAPLEQDDIDTIGLEQRVGEGRMSLQAPAKPQRLAQVGALAARGMAALYTHNTVELLGQLGLGDLRMLAREYDVTSNGMSRQQLVETVLDALRQPEAVRRVAATLEKLPRQLLATLTLAGGFLTDDDLHGLIERFQLGQIDQVQTLLTTLQSKGLLLRTSFTGIALPRIGSLPEGGWYVPLEVRTALRVMVPVTAFDVRQKESGEGTSAPELRRSQPYRLLADLLLVARTLDGYQSRYEDERDGGVRVPESGMRRPTVPLSPVGSTIPVPSGRPSPASLDVVQAELPISQGFARFAVRLLRVADILHKDDGGTPYLRALPGSAQLLLGPNASMVARDLFELWLTHADYEELFDLQEEGLRVCCRSTPLNHPVLRPGELEAENSEARQWLVALLSQAPLNRWISFAAFARFIYRLNPWFLQRRQRLYASPHWWIEHEEGSPLQPLQSSDWQQAEGRYLARLLQGPLNWWGVCDLALSANGRLLAFRLTPLAGWLFNGIPVDEQNVLEQDTGEEAERGEDGQTRAPLEVLESGEILLACNTQTWPLIERVEAFAEVAGVRSGRLCYRLSPTALSDALSKGQRPDALLSLLRQLSLQEGSDDPLARLLARLERWIASYGRVRLYSDAALLEVADGLVMRELQATTSLDEQVLRPLSPTLFLLRKQGAERMLEDLKRRGQTPLLHGEEWDGAERS